MDESPNNHESPSRDRRGADANGLGPPKTIVHDPDTGGHRVAIRSETESVAMAVVSTVAVYSDTDPAELAPIATAVDPDALDSAFHTYGPDLQVTFPYCNYEVTVHGTREITLTPADD